ncbi:MAG TPA: amidase [Candidatus Polarisedimenticolia bacterium]|nr:amidase [Candidatus Polarisedimenticolia bacterium]
MDSATGASQTSAPSRELAFRSALQAADAIRKKEISSVELTRHIFERIERYNPALNAFVYQMKEEALLQAKKADEAVARKEPGGVFHGVPISVKESFAVAGQPCTWGMPPFKDSRASQNAAVVDRLVDAGAILIGATNVPVNLSDWQSYNSIYGTSNNPWDLKRTPGGSSGGTAAAVAAGLGYLSVGSDIGGSIRVPSHFCGIYGHKPTLDIVSLRGHQPGGISTPPGFSTLLAVAGPMARSANDLLAALRVLGGPEGWDRKAWKWELPPARREKLKDFRVGYILDDPIAPPAPDVRVVLEKTLKNLDRLGVKMKPGWPAGFQPSALLDTYRYMLFAFFISMSPPEAQQALRQQFEKIAGSAEAQALASFPRWQAENLRRLGFRAHWQAYFDEIDVFLSPVTFTAAFPHDHSEPQEQRSIATAAGPRNYMDGLNWISPAILTGCPATAAPVGRTQAGLPVGIQIMGPYGEDATCIAFADLLAQEVGGFTPPPGYDD